MPAGLQTTSPVRDDFGSDCEVTEIYWVPTADAQYVTIDVVPFSGTIPDSVLEYCVYTTSDSVRHVAPSDSASVPHTYADHHHSFFIPAGCLAVSFLICNQIGDPSRAVTVSFGSGAAFCQYGSETNPDANVTVVITEALVAIAVALTGGGLLIETALAVIIGLPLVVPDVCAVPPPALPSFTWDDVTGSFPFLTDAGFEKALDYLRAAIWLTYCRCTAAPAGEPDPVPPDQPVLPPGDPGADPGVRTPLVCDNEDLCAALTQLSHQIDALSLIASYTLRTVTFMQRQDVPIGYVTGAAHGPLAGAGDFAVYGIIGLAVSFSSLPAPTDTAPADPATYHSIGKVTIGTGDGWERSYMPTHSPYLIFPVSAAVTKVGYAFADGVTATITELIRQP